MNKCLIVRDEDEEPLYSIGKDDWRTVYEHNRCLSDNVVRGFCDALDFTD